MTFTRPCIRQYDVKSSQVTVNTNENKNVHCQISHMHLIT